MIEVTEVNEYRFIYLHLYAKLFHRKYINLNSFSSLTTLKVPKTTSP